MHTTQQGLHVGVKPAKAEDIGTPDRGNPFITPSGRYFANAFDAERQTKLEQDRAARLEGRRQRLASVICEGCKGTRQRQGEIPARVLLIFADDEQGAREPREVDYCAVCLEFVTERPGWMLQHFDIREVRRVA